MVYQIPVSENAEGYQRYGSHKIYRVILADCIQRIADNGGQSSSMDQSVKHPGPVLVKALPAQPGNIVIKQFMPALSQCQEQRQEKGTYQKAPEIAVTAIIQAETAPKPVLSIPAARGPRQI